MTVTVGSPTEAWPIRRPVRGGRRQKYSGRCRAAVTVTTVATVTGDSIPSLGPSHVAALSRCRTWVWPVSLSDLGCPRAGPVAFRVAPLSPKQTVTVQPDGTDLSSGFKFWVLRLFRHGVGTFKFRVRASGPGPADWNAGPGHRASDGPPGRPGRTAGTSEHCIRLLVQLESRLCLSFLVTVVLT